MKKMFFFWSLLVLVSGLFASVSAQTDDFPFEMVNYTLENGLEVTIVQDSTAPVVAVNVWYRVGGANDPDGRSGFAHLFEHMMFQGTANLDKEQFLRIIEDAGGELNAYTSTDQTVYYETVPAHQLPLALWLEADRMASLAVTQTNLDNQRAVVIQEFQQSYGNSPYGEALLELFTLPFSYSPYQTAPIGSVEDLNMATVEEITAFHETYYVPNNASLAVVGDLDLEQTRELIDQFFAPIPRGEEPPALPEFVPQPQAEAEIITVKDDLINIPAVLIGYETIPYAHPDYPALSLATYILSVGDSSRMAREMVDTGVALVADTVVLDNLGPSLFGVLLLPNFNTTVEAVESAYDEQVARMIAEGVSEDELAKAVNQIRSGEIFALESVFALAESVQSANFYYDNPNDVFASIDRFEQVTSADIQRVLAQYLAPEARHIIYVEPSQEAGATYPDPFVGATGNPSDDEFEVDFALSYTEAPTPLDIKAFNLPQITQATLDNGLQVVVIEHDDIPVISLDMVMKGGSTLVDADLAGIVGMTGGLLTRGTETRTAQELAAEIEQVGGNIGASASDDYVTAGIFALTEHTDLAFELLSDVVLHATFPQDEIDLQRDQIRTALEAELKDPEAQVSRLFSQKVYRDHPYGQQATFETVDAITRDDIVAFYDAVRHPENALLVVAGDVRFDEIMPLVESAFGGWVETDTPPVIEYPELEPVTGEDAIYLVNVPGATQAQLRIGNLGLFGTDPQRYQVSVMNSILGSGFPSRLMQNLREDKGYTYGIGSGFTYPSNRGTFRISTSVNAGATANAIREIFYEVERLRTEPVSEAELVGVRDGMVGRYALQLETYQDFVNQLASFWVRGIDFEQIRAYPELIGSVTVEDVQQSAQEAIPSDFVVVVAGDASILLSQLEELGAVEVIELEE